MFDNHVHSNFSTDSNLDANYACEIAINKGLEGIAFTDHVDIDYPRIDFSIDFAKYHEVISKLQIKYKGKLQILKGLEVGMQEHVMTETDKIIKENNFDFVIASIHLLERLDPYDKVYYENKTKSEAYTNYLQEILKGISYFNDFDIPGHLDFIIRFAPYEERSLFYSDYSDIIDAIFDKLIKAGKGIEINTGSYRKIENIKTAVLDMNIYKRFKELGGEIVTIGSDSHSEAFLGYDFKYYIDLLKDCGFKYIAHFEGRKPVFEKI